MEPRTFVMVRRLPLRTPTMVRTSRVMPGALGAICVLLAGAIGGGCAIGRDAERDPVPVAAAASSQATPVEFADSPFDPETLAFSRGSTWPSFAERPSFSLLDAYWSSRLARLSYSPSEQIQSELERRSANGQSLQFQFFDADNGGAWAYYVGSSDWGALVFRGTQQRIDWLINIDWQRTQNVGPGLALAHHGFSSSLDARMGERTFWQGVLKGLAEHGHSPGSKKRLYVTGDSLGAAFANVAAYRLMYSGCWDSLVSGNITKSQKGRWQDSTLPLEQHSAEDRACLRDFVPVTAVYTFGQPRVGNPQYASMFLNRARETGMGVFRLVNASDIVPSFPPAPLYRHVGIGDDEHSLRISLAPDGTLGWGLPPNSEAATCGRVGDHNVRFYGEKLLALARARWEHQPLTWKASCKEDDPSDPLVKLPAP